MIASLRAIIIREFLRFIHQKERFFASLVRPLVWLFIFGAGFRAALGLSRIPPYQTYILYDTYIVPGLLAMIILFNAMQSSLSIVYDREMGSMRILLSAPLPRWWVLMSKLIASAIISILQCVAFLIIVYIYGIEMRLTGYAYAIPAIALTGIMFGAFGLMLSSAITRLQNFAGIMNFVIFPVFFASTALYPLWRIRENAPELAHIVQFNPFSHAVEFIRFALYDQFHALGFVVVTGCFFVFFALAVRGYDPAKTLFKRKLGQ